MARVVCHAAARVLTICCLLKDPVCVCHLCSCPEAKDTAARAYCCKAMKKLKAALAAALAEGTATCVATQIAVFDAVCEVGSAGCVTALDTLAVALSRTDGTRHAAVCVLDTLAKNLGLSFFITLAHHARALEAAYALGTDARAGATRKVLLDLIEAVAVEFKTSTELQPITQLYKDLRRRGAPFAGTDSGAPPPVPLVLPPSQPSTSQPATPVSSPVAARPAADRLLSTDAVGPTTVQNIDEDAIATAIAVAESLPLGVLLASAWGGSGSGTASAADVAALNQAMRVLESMDNSIIYPPTSTAAMLKKRAGVIVRLRNVLVSGGMTSGTVGAKEGSEGTPATTAPVPAPKLLLKLPEGPGAPANSPGAWHAAAAAAGGGDGSEPKPGPAVPWLHSRLASAAVASEEDVSLAPRLVLRRGSSALQSLSQASTPLGKSGGGGGSGAPSAAGTPTGGGDGGVWGSATSFPPSTPGSPVVSLLSPATVVKNPFAALTGSRP